MDRSFDTAIGSAHTPRPTTARPGRIRRWLAITALLLVAAHVVAADPLGRLRADLRLAAAMQPTDTCSQILEAGK